MLSPGLASAAKLTDPLTDAKAGAAIVFATSCVATVPVAGVEAATVVGVAVLNWNKGGLVAVVADEMAAGTEAVPVEMIMGGGSVFETVDGDEVAGAASGVAALNWNSPGLTPLVAVAFVDAPELASAAFTPNPNVGFAPAVAVAVVVVVLAVATNPGRDPEHDGHLSTVMAFSPRHPSHRHVVFAVLPCPQMPAGLASVVVAVAVAAFALSAALDGAALLEADSLIFVVKAGSVLTADFCAVSKDVLNACASSLFFSRIENFSSAASPSLLSIATQQNAFSLPGNASSFI